MSFLLFNSVLLLKMFPQSFQFLQVHLFTANCVASVFSVSCFGSLRKFLLLGSRDINNICLQIICCFQRGLRTFLKMRKNKNNFVFVFTHSNRRHLTAPEVKVVEEQNICSNRDPQKILVSPKPTSRRWAYAASRFRFAFVFVKYDRFCSVGW